jgi:hypothetical protein
MVKKWTKQRGLFEIDPVVERLGDEKSRLRRVIVITGLPAAVKSHLLSQWTQRLRRRWQVCGIESHPQEVRKVGSNTVAASYPVRIIGTNRIWPWALLRPDSLERDYPEETRQALIGAVASRTASL